MAPCWKLDPGPTLAPFFAPALPAKAGCRGFFVEIEEERLPVVHVGLLGVNVLDCE
jgi:hypothetical protein